MIVSKDDQSWNGSTSNEGGVTVSKDDQSWNGSTLTEGGVTVSKDDKVVEWFYVD